MMRLRLAAGVWVALVVLGSPASAQGNRSDMSPGELLRDPLVEMRIKAEKPRTPEENAHADSVRKTLRAQVDSMVATRTAAHATCHGPDAISARMVAEFTRIAASADSLTWLTRYHMGLPRVARNQVAYVTEDAICDKAAAMYDVATASSPPVTPSGSLYLVQVGSVYVVWDPAKMMGEYRQVVVLSDGFEFVSASMM